jgi:hypothetical protein
LWEVVVATGEGDDFGDQRMEKSLADDFLADETG